MSEFSDSYHLRADHLQAGVDLLRAAGLGGYVFPPENGWVTVLPEGEPFKPNQALIRAAAGVLLHYVNAADHGWAFELYRGGSRLARYEAEWGNDFAVLVDEMPRQVLDELLGDGFRALSAEQMRAIFHPTFDEFLDRGDDAPADLFAEAAGLTNYSWLSYEYVDGDYDDDPEIAEQGVVRVG
jgi:hypothetical protein